MFLVQAALAAHNYAHFNDSCSFDESVFSNRMKVGLYNSKRNETSRTKVDNGPPDNGENKVHEQEKEPDAFETTTRCERDLDMPAPAEVGNAVQEGIAAEKVAQCLDDATRRGRCFASNIRLIRSAVFKRDPQGQNMPLQNALKMLLHGARHGDVPVVQDALVAMQAEVDLGKEL